MGNHPLASELRWHRQERRPVVDLGPTLPRVPTHPGAGGGIGGLDTRVQLRPPLRWPTRDRGACNGLPMSPTGSSPKFLEGAPTSPDSRGATPTLPRFSGPAQCGPRGVHHEVIGPGPVAGPPAVWPWRGSATALPGRVSRAGGAAFLVSDRAQTGEVAPSHHHLLPSPHHTRKF